MTSKPNAEEFAEIAYSYLNSKIPYSTWDCQAFVENILKKVGVSRNWRGSNHMWREALSWKGTPEECVLRYGRIPPGAWVFTLKNDGGEKARGYNDSEGNASHVGIYTGKGQGVMHSTTGGVQQGPWPDKRWNRVGLSRDLEYHLDKIPQVNQPTINQDKLLEALEMIKEIVEGVLHGGSTS